MNRDTELEFKNKVLIFYLSCCLHWYDRIVLLIMYNIFLCLFCKLCSTKIFQTVISRIYKLQAGDWCHNKIYYSPHDTPEVAKLCYFVVKRSCKVKLSCCFINCIETERTNKLCGIFTAHNISYLLVYRLTQGL